VEKINQREKTATMVAGLGRLGSDSIDGLSIVVFVAANSIATKAVNTALFLARQASPYLFLQWAVCHNHNLGSQS
jgi:hypothetical protein